jgi:hypothetical protein
MPRWPRLRRCEDFAMPHCIIALSDDRWSECPARGWVVRSMHFRISGSNEEHTDCYRDRDLARGARDGRKRAGTLRARP